MCFETTYQLLCISNIAIVEFLFIFRTLNCCQMEYKLTISRLLEQPLFIQMRNRDHKMPLALKPLLYIARKKPTGACN